MWAQYRCLDDPENEGYWLNVARAERCLNAWADVEGDCTSYREPGELFAKGMRWSTMTSDLKPFRMNQWDGNYSDPKMRTNAMRPCGLMQHSWEALGECKDNDYRFAGRDVFEEGNHLDRPIFTDFRQSVRCPFYEYCWQETYCSSA